MPQALTAAEVFVLQTREAVRAYVRQLAGWDKATVKEDFLAALDLIERAEDDQDLAAELLATPEPSNLDDLLTGKPIKTAAA